MSNSLHKLYILSCLLICALLPASNLLINGDFEAGLLGWTTEHWWYEAKVDGKGTGISKIEVDKEVARTGTSSLKIIGKGNRGIAMQVLQLPPATYLVRGYIKCEDLGDARAEILVEFLDREGKWFHGETVGGVSQTADWTLVEREITFPPQTRWVHFDLLTTAPNNGIAWFDAVELIPLTADVPIPTPKVTQQPSDAGEISLSWEVKDPRGVKGYEVYIEPRPFQSLKGLQPKATFDFLARQGTVRFPLRVSTAYVAVVPVMIDGRKPQEVKPLKMNVKDSKPPQAVELFIRNSSAKPDSLFIRWRPNPLDLDIQAFRLKVRTEEGKEKELARLSPKERLHWLPRKSLPKDAREISVTAVDFAGNESVPTWHTIPRPTSPAPLNIDLWVTSPLTNVFRDTPKPPSPSQEIDIISARNETECTQVVLRSPFSQKVWLEATPLLHEDGKSSISAQNISLDFVGYIHVEKNSTLTPPEELARQAPADFPDPLLEDWEINLSPEENQPFLLKVFVPKDAKPGLYSGKIFVVGEEGNISIPLRLRVFPVTLPDRLPIFVTNWFTTSAIATFHNIPEWSEDFWKIMRLYAKEMRRGHQNVVLTPLSLIKIWQEEDGRLTFDFSDFDRWVELFLAEGFERLELSHLGGRTTGEWECPTFSLPPRPAMDRATGQMINVPLEEFLPQLQRHLEEKGWLDRTLMHIGDEPIMVNVASWREQSTFAHRYAPKLKRIDAIHVPATELAGYLEVFVPQLNYLVEWLNTYKEIQRKGLELWFYTAWVPQGKFLNRLLDYPLIKSRLLPWCGYLYGVTGWLHWGLNFWTPELKDMGFAPGDNWVLYPGKFGPRSSLRWEAMRDGFEDFALLSMLPREKAMPLVQRVIRSATDYSRDPGELESVRRLLLEALSQK